MKLTSMIVAPLAAGALVACGDGTGPAGGGNMTLKFTMAPGMAAGEAGLSLAQAAITALPLEGTNGTLTLDETWLVVEKVELTPAADACGGTDDDDDDDEESASRVALHDGWGDEGDDDDNCAVALGPFFVSIPLGDEGTGEVTVDVVPGAYEEIELRTGAPNDSDDADFLAQIREAFADWPANASLLVVGSFTPTDGEAVPFRVYFKARIEIEQEFEDDPLVVEEGGDLTVTVVIDPAPWFTNADGTVDDLSLYDFDATGEVVDFGMRSREGCRIERDDD
jgi:hypothetical protein